MKNKLILAYSGGLDTTFCIKYLCEQGYEVHTITVNTGGFSINELSEIETKAYQLGVKSHTNKDITQKYYDKCIRFLIAGNVLKNNTYPLSVSSERSFQAMEIVDFAKINGAKYIAHGSTGAGNDQIRFDSTIKVLAPDIELITPVRDMKLSRQDEIEYLESFGINYDWAEMEYSINKGIWGTSIGGNETLKSKGIVPEEAYTNQLKESEPRDVQLSFKNGELIGVDNLKFRHTIDAIHELNSIGGKYAIGRDVHVGDTILGIKGRIAFEAPAAILIIKAHHLLEKHVLTKWQMHWKDQLANWYGMLLHEGQYLDPVMKNIESFLLDAQANVNGKVFLRLHPYRFELLGIESDDDLMNPEYALYGEENKSWSDKDVKGFINITSNHLKLFHQSNKKQKL